MLLATLMVLGAFAPLCLQAASLERELEELVMKQEDEMDNGFIERLAQLQDWQTYDEAEMKGEEQGYLNTEEAFQQDSDENDDSSKIAEGQFIRILKRIFRRKRRPHRRHRFHFRHPMVRRAPLWHAPLRHAMFRPAPLWHAPLRRAIARRHIGHMIRRRYPY